MILKKKGSGKIPYSLGFNVSDTNFSHSWILDSGATDHMTPLPLYFSTYSPCPSNKKISTADGTLITAAVLKTEGNNCFIPY